MWITILAIKDKNGFVYASVPGLADFARVTVDECRQALKILLSPDPDSRTKEFEGRRIEEVDGGWMVLNHFKYRNMMELDERREYNRIKQQQHRASKNVNNVKQCKQMSTLSAHTDTDANTDTVKEVPQIPSPKAPVARRKRVKPLEASEVQPALITLPAETNASLPVADAQTAPPSASSQALDDSDANNAAWDKLIEKNRPNLPKKDFGGVWKFEQISPGPSDHTIRVEFIDDFCAAFKARFGVDYTFDGGRDGAAVKKLFSKGLDHVQILDTAKKAWDNGSFYAKHARTLHGLNNYYTQINVEVNGKDTNAPIKAPARVDRNAGTCNENIDHDKFAEEVRAYNRARFLRPASPSNEGSVPSMAGPVEGG